MDKFYIDYANTPFLETSKTAANPNRLNWRCEILLTRNQEAIEGKRVLDLASHDGRFSYACLKLGASHVTGVEGRHYLVESAQENLKGLGYKAENFSFVHDDVFNYLSKVQPKDFDTILCFGFFYHTVKQNVLFEELRRIQATYFILDSHIARGIFAIRFQRFRFTHQGAYTKTPKKLLNRLNPILILGKFKRILFDLNRLAQGIVCTENRKPCLVFMTENHELEAATIDDIDLVAWPTKTFIELVFKSYGFSFKQLYWDKKQIDDWTDLLDYKAGERGSYFAVVAEK